MGINYAALLKVIRGGALWGAAFIATTIVGGFILQLCVGADWYDHPWATVGKLIAAVLWLLAWPWFHWVGGAVFGFAAGVWLDAFLRNKDAEQKKQHKAPITVSTAHLASIPKANDPLPAPAPYRQHVLEMGNPVSTKNGGSNGELESAQTAINVRNVSRIDLKNCVIAVLSISDGRSTAVVDTFIGGTRMADNKTLSPIFALPRGGQRSATLITRNLADLVSRPPHLLSLGSGKFPLADNTTYTLQIELRSEAPTPTKVTMQIAVGEREVLVARILDQSV